ncbi:hypothetical protein ABIA07_003204 [Bradyrhizobium yuanmingense]
MSSTANTVTQMLEEKPASCGRRKLPIRIGSINTQPCITGITKAGQRRCTLLRRSVQSSLAVSAAYTETMPAPTSMRSIDEAGSSSVAAATQASAPSTSPGQFGLRPWKTRAAFQTMPQATKPTAFSAR